MNYRFTKIGDTIADTYSPEVVTTTDTEQIDDIFQAFIGFLVSVGWCKETIDGEILDLADNIGDD